MKVDMEFKGLEDLVRAFERAASDNDIRETNKKIVKKSQEVVRRVMSGKIPKSRDLSKSGRGFGTKSHVSAHAADSIPMGAMKHRGTSVSAEVGWDKSDKSPHFYVKFINWGTENPERKAREFIHSSMKEADKELQSVAEKEYRAYLDSTVG